MKKTALIVVIIAAVVASAVLTADMRLSAAVASVGFLALVIMSIGESHNGSGDRDTKRG